MTLLNVAVNVKQRMCHFFSFVSGYDTGLKEYSRCFADGASNNGAMLKNEQLFFFSLCIMAVVHGHVVPQSPLFVAMGHGRINL